MHLFIDKISWRNYPSALLFFPDYFTGRKIGRVLLQRGQEV